MSPNRYLRRPLAAAATAALAAVLTAVALGANTAEIDTRVSDTLNQFYSQSDKHRDLAQKASAVLVFPRITKAGAGVGGEFGEGALQTGGRTVGYYKVTGGSVGATLGVARHSEVILFMTDAARDHFMSSHDWSIGADASVAVVKKGAGGEYDTETLRKPVLAFLFNEKGLMGDISLQGAKISKLPSGGAAQAQ
jgi:lipid-binding SYLF domain-containing protein